MIERGVLPCLSGGLLVLGLVGAPVLGGEVERLELAGAVELALAENPGLRAVSALRGEVEGGVTEARADAFPQLTAVTSWTRFRDPSLLNSPDFEDLIQQFPGFRPSEQELTHLGLEVSQSLYTGGKIRAAVDLARLAVDVAEARIRTAELDTAAAAARAYFAVLGSRAALEVTELQEASRRAALEVVEDRYEIGEATELERLRAEASLAEVAPEVETLRGALEVARANLKMVIGRDQGVEIDVAPVSGSPPPRPSTEALVDVALGSRPELRDLALQEQVLLRRKVISGADGRPQVEVTGAWGRTARLPGNLDDDLFSEWGVVLGLRWSFFDGGRRRGEVAQLESQREQVAYQRAELVARIGLEIRQAVTAFDASIARLAAARRAREAAVEASRVAEASYREGVALQADWIAAQDQARRAEQLEVADYYRSWTARVGLARAVGRLPSEPLLPPAERDGRDETRGGSPR